MSLFSKKVSKKITIAGVQIAVFSLTIKQMIEFQALQAKIEKEPATIVVMLTLLHTLIDQSVQAVSVEDLSEMSVTDLSDFIKNVATNS